MSTLTADQKEAIMAARGQSAVATTSATNAYAIHLEDVRVFYCIDSGCH